MSEMDQRGEHDEYLQTSTRGESLRKLSALIKLNIDLVKAYRIALKKTTVQEVRNQLIHFQSDHERHIAELSAIVRDLGAEPPAMDNLHLEGILLEAFTAVRSLSGTQGAVRAMKVNEILSERRYEEALRDVTIPEPALAVLRKLREDESRHERYLLTTSEASWEQTADAEEQMLEERRPRPVGSELSPNR